MNGIVITQQAQIQNNSTNLENMLDSFIGFLDVSPNTVRSYSYGIRYFLRYVADNHITHPTRDTVIAYKTKLAAEKSAATVSLYLSAIRRFFAWTESAGLYQNITTGIKSPKISKTHRKDCFSGAQLKTIISGIDRQSLEGKRNYAIFTLAACCGLRTIEITRANIGDIHAVTGVKLLDVMGKGHAEKDAFVKLPEPVMTAINDYLGMRGHVSNDEPLFTSCSRRNKGERLTTATISSVCKKAMRKAGFDSKRLTAHSLRHSAITLALLAGGKLDEVSAFARHSSIAITQVYNHSVQRLKSACENNVAGAIFYNW